MNLTLSETKLLKLPHFKDDEEQTIRVTTFQSKKQILPSFVTFDSDKLFYSIKPLSLDHLGSYSIQVNLTDSAGATSTYLFDINVGFISGNGSRVFGGS